MDHSKKTTIQ